MLIQDVTRALKNNDVNTALVHLGLIDMQLTSIGRNGVTPIPTSEVAPTISKVGSLGTPPTTITQEYKNGYNAGYSDGKADFGRGIDLNTHSFNDVQGSINYREGYQVGYRDGWTWFKSVSRTCYDEHDIVVTCQERLSNGATSTMHNDTTTQYVTNGTNIGNITASVPYNVGNITSSGNMTQDNTTFSTPVMPSQGNITGENLAPSEATQSPPKSGIDWVSICTTIQPALYPSCDTLVNSDGTLTPEGQHAADCIKNGALLAGGAMAAGSTYGVPVAPSLIAKGLSILATPTGCGGIVKMDQINNVVNALGGIGTLSHLLP